MASASKADPALAQPPLLGVTQSYSGYRWALRPADDRAVFAIAQTYGVPDCTARIMAARGIASDEINSFLNGTLRDGLPDPAILKDMDVAVARICAAIKAGEQITIFGDYDVDGATSSACLLRYFRAIGHHKIDAYIPDRVKEGYGPTAPAMETIAGRGASLLIAVDCGIQSFDALAHAKSLGLDVIILDHHKALEALPACVAAVNPNRLDDTSGLGVLAAVGVVFLMLVALQRALREAGFFNADRPEPPLLDLLDLVALGTVADVAPLSGVNRLLVRQGLKVMAMQKNIGMRALASVAGLDDRPDAGHLGFLFGPRVNAGGRVGESRLGTDLLSTYNPDQAQEIAALLDGYNAERRAIEAQVLDDALQHIADPGDAPIVVAIGAGWHQGVIGIVASRLKDRFSRPALCISTDGALAKGSGRSIAGVDLGAAVLAAREAGLLTAGGGHAMAAGLSLKVEKLEAFQAFLREHLAVDVQKRTQTRTHIADHVLTLGAATPQTVADVEQLAPFGMGNPAPRFVFPNVTLSKIDVVGKDHVRMFITDGAGQRRKAMSFRSAETPLGGRLLAAQGRQVHLLARLKRDDWGSEPKAELHLEDAADA